MNEAGLQAWLDLNGLQMNIGDGYWVKFKVWLVKPDKPDKQSTWYSI